MRKYSFIPSRSYFVGPTGLFKGKERRRYWRVLWAILSRGNTEPTELFMVITLATTGMTLLMVGDNDFLKSPFWAMAYLLVALAGIGGLLTRNKAGRMWFGFFVFYLRIWVATLSFAANPSDLQWCGALVGAGVGAWIFLRYWCALIVLREREKRKEEAKTHLNSPFLSDEWGTQWNSDGREGKRSAKHHRDHHYDRHRDRELAGG